MRKEMSPGPAASSGATPCTTREGSPSSVAPRATAICPSVRPAGAVIALFLSLRPRLLVVGPDDLVGQVGFGRRIQHAGAPALDDHVVALLLAELLDHSH